MIGAATDSGVQRRPHQQAAHDLLRENLLDAAAHLLQEYTWSDISMAAIATRAGVSRQTLYNEFGSRDEFAQAFALREADRFITSIEGEIERHADDPRKALRTAFAAFLREAAGNPMVRQIVVREPGADELFALFTTRGGPVVELATFRIQSKMLELWPGVEPARAALGAEGLVRLAISHAGLPTSPVEEASQMVGDLIGPYVDEALAEAGVA